VVTLPSLSLDAEVLAKITGAHHYEERMLCRLLRLQRARPLERFGHIVAPDARRTPS
jgi:hypothetical protein